MKDAFSRIGIFGGLFDPIHNGHISLLKTAISELTLDHLFIIPTGIPAHKKKSLFPSDKRLEMVKSVVAALDNISVSDIEIKEKGVSYTYKTLLYFKEKYSCEIFFIIGADNILNIKDWQNPEIIFDTATLAVAKRPGYSSLKEHPKYSHKMVQFDAPLHNISSTEIREMLEKNISVKEFVPEEVLGIISKITT